MHMQTRSETGIRSPAQPLTTLHVTLLTYHMLHGHTYIVVSSVGRQIKLLLTMWKMSHLHLPDELMKQFSSSNVAWVPSPENCE